MRIISGTAGGIPIKVPALVARPTTDQVREAVFSMMADVVADAVVLDLFAGSGGMGLEALSRGAASAVFVEQNGKACGVIQENLTRSRLQGAQVQKAEVFATIRRLALGQQRFDLVFADPPYAKQPSDPDLARQLLQSDELRQILAPHGFLVLESMVTKRADEAMPEWSVVRDRAYGSTRIRILQPVTTKTDAEIPGAADLQPAVSHGAPGHDAGSHPQDEEPRWSVE